MKTPPIVIAGSRAADLRTWDAWLQVAGIPSCSCTTTQQMLARSDAERTFIFLGIYRADARLWLAGAQKVRALGRHVRIVVLANESSEELAIQALRAGADDYLRGPLNPEVVLGAAREWLEGVAGVSLQRDVPDGIIGESRSVVNLRDQLRRLSGSDCNVLITGESGTGKELAAAALHRLSNRRNASLVCLNCAAIPDSLVESELFGYEKGAFTGADAGRDGKLKGADGGVVFLDEIGDLSAFAQAKILRAVEAKEFYRLGSQQATPVNVRVVAATHRNLEQMVAEGRFRQDLFFRLNIGRVHIPPLRERIEDLRLLAMHYLQLINRQMGGTVRSFSDEAWRILSQYWWPGNVRELRNVVESAIVNAVSPVVSAEDLPAHLRATPAAEPSRDERRELVEALDAAKWNKTKAAEQLRWSRMTLYRKMAKYAVSSACGKRLA